MKTLNLVYPDKSDITYKIQKFPDGQQDIVIDSITDGGDFGGVKPTFKMINCQIKSHFNSFKDLELIICATKALRRLDVKEIHLYIPYLLGARSDRQFVEGGTSYLVDVVAPIINSLEFESVTVIDVHSDVAAACIKNLNIVSNLSLTREFFRVTYGLAETRKENPFVLISPDAGSLKKIYKVAEDLDYKNDIIICSKHRDTNGKLTATVVPMGKHWVSDKDVIIIDDICDGGATFINIAKQLKNNGWKNKIYLIVTHGIFSKGFEELSQYFDGIYCTNSYQDIDFEARNIKLQQLNVF